MKQYYYLKGVDKIGPLTEDEIISSNQKPTTLMWTEGITDWTPLKDIPELFEKYKLKNPPETPKHIANLNERRKKIHRNAFNLLIGWTSFHTFAMIMSYCELKIFNPNGEFSTKSFWPFVDFYKEVEIHSLFDTHYSDIYRRETKKVFDGIFVNYDFTEFGFYIVFGLVLFFIFKRWANSN